MKLRNGVIRICTTVCPSLWCAQAPLPKCPTPSTNFARLFMRLLAIPLVDSLHLDQPRSPSFRNFERRSPKTITCRLWMSCSLIVLGHYLYLETAVSDCHEGRREEPPCCHPHVPYTTLKHAPTPRPHPSRRYRRLLPTRHRHHLQRHPEVNSHAARPFFVSHSEGHASYFVSQVACTTVAVCGAGR